MTRSPRSGRPPKPHNLKVIEGNPGKRKLAEAPKAPPSTPTMPSYLTAYAKTEWRRIVPILDSVGLLTQVDRQTLAAYCEAVATFKAATETIAQTGILVQGRRKGEAIKNPALQVQRDAARLIATYSAMFGLSPSDRVRLLADPSAGRGHHGGGDPLEALLQ